MSDDQFIQLRDQLTGLDGQFTQLRDQVTSLDSKITTIDAKVTGHDDRFATMEARLATVDDKITGHDDKFANLDKSLAQMFVYMTQRFDRLEETKADKADVDRVYDLLDGLVKRVDDDEVERSAMTNQLDRHERWHQQTARKLGIKLK